MTGPNGNNLGDGELWVLFSRATRRPNPPASAAQAKPSADSDNCPEALTLAAYIDGRLTEAEAEVLESHLAGCSQCIAAVREARELIAAGPVLVHAGVARRAKTLVQSRETYHRRWAAGLGWAAAAAIAIGISGLGFGAGRGLASTRQQIKTSLAQGAAAGMDDLLGQSEPASEELAFLLQGDSGGSRGSGESGGAENPGGAP